MLTIFPLSSLLEFLFHSNISFSSLKYLRIILYTKWDMFQLNITITPLQQTQTKNVKFLHFSNQQHKILKVTKNFTILCFQKKKCKSKSKLWPVKRSKLISRSQIRLNASRVRFSDIWVGIKLERFFVDISLSTSVEYL